MIKYMLKFPNHSLSLLSCQRIFYRKRKFFWNQEILKCKILERFNLVSTYTYIQRNRSYLNLDQTFRLKLYE